MQPQTPKSTEKKNLGVTPSFTFGSLAPSPSHFRFVSPRNMNILSSLSPQRLFQRFCRQPDANDPNEIDEIDHTTLSSLEMDSAVLDNPIMSPFEGSRASQTFHNESTVDSVHTADSADIWSFAGDSHAVGINMTAVTETSAEKDFYFSPHDIFLEHSPLDSEVSMATSTATTQNSQMKGLLPKSECRTPKSRKKSFSAVRETPCSKAALEIDRFQSSPSRQSHISAEEDVRVHSKVWTSLLDDELFRCLAKLNAYRAAHDPNDVLFKGTSQNKILSRMLHKKTRVVRTQKQISGRISRLAKAVAPKIVVDDVSECSPVSPIFEDNSEKPGLSTIEPKTPQHSASKQNTRATRGSALIQSFDALNISFRYKDSRHPSHVFASLETKSPKRYDNVSLADAKKQLPGKNTRFLAEFDELSVTLKTQGVQIHNVFCSLNLNPEMSAVSTPISPMTNPRQLSLENGTFSSHLQVTLNGSQYSESLVSLKSHITVYKNTDQILFRKEENVNGYRGDGQHFNLEVPFLSQFWAGFLTYIVSGTSDFADLENLVVMQTICDGASSEKVLGLFVYRFAPSQTGTGEARVEVMSLAESTGLAAAQDDIDELETILASSPLRYSPMRPSPSITNLQIRVDLARKYPTPGPNSAPMFNSEILHQNNINFDYSQVPQQRPGMVSSKSTPHFNLANRHASSMTMQDSQPLNTGIRHHSAGQMGSFMQSQGPRHSQPLSSPALGSSCFAQKPMSGPPASSFQVQGQFPVQAPGQFPGSYPNQIPSGQYAPDSAPLQQVPMNPGQASFPQNAQNVPYQMPYQQPYMNRPIAIAPRTNENGTRAPYPITTAHHYPQEINSAPASQVKFFPNKGSWGQDQGTPLKIQSMIQYDPAKSKTTEVKAKRRKTNFHTFPVTKKIEFHSENSDG